MGKIILKELWELEKLKLYSAFTWTSLVVQMVKNLPAMWETRIRFLGWEEPLEKGISTSTILARKLHGQRSLAGYSPWDHKESDMTE